jgi:hypothetical protein
MKASILKKVLTNKTIKQMGDKFKKKVKAIKNPNTKFYFLVLCGIGFGIWGGLTPPEGEISPSFLVLIAQFFILAATILGLDIKFNIKDGIFESGDIDEEEKK